MSDNITFYTSNTCPQARSVSKLFEKHNIATNKINISHNDEAKAELIELNGGYASVPTLVFPDGTKLTEPSMKDLRAKLGLPQPSFFKRIMDAFQP